MNTEQNHKWIIGCYKYYRKNAVTDKKYWTKWLNGCLKKYKENEEQNSSTSTKNKGWRTDIERVLFSLNRRH